MLQPWPDGTRWLACHLFFNHPGIYTGECDGLVLEMVEPFVRRALAEGWADGHFFIRYSEHGPHVRMRLHGRDEVLENEAWPALQAHVRSFYPDVSFEKPDVPAYTPYVPPEQQVVPDEAFRVTHAALIEYEPEVERYGGPEGVRLAERMFQISSDAAYALLQRTSRTERSSRLGKGLLTMVQLFHVFSTGRAHATRWAEQYNMGYLRGVARDEQGRDAWLGAFGSGYDAQAETLGAYVEEVWTRMEEGDSLSDALDLYADGLREVRGHFRALFDAGTLAGPAGVWPEWEAAVGAIASSYMHMMNNRLGITIQEESYLAYLIMRTLGQPAAAVAEGTEEDG